MLVELVHRLQEQTAITGGKAFRSHLHTEFVKAKRSREVRNLIHRSSTWRLAKAVEGTDASSSDAVLTVLQLDSL